MQPAGTCHTQRRGVLLALAAMLPLSAFDLHMSLVAQRRCVLTSYSECNPLAAAALRRGPAALTAFKIGLTAAGTVGLALCRRHPWTRQVAVGVVLVYAGVTLHWYICWEVFNLADGIPANVASFLRCDGSSHPDW